MPSTSSDPRLVPLAVGPDPRDHGALDRLEAALDGTGPAVAPHADGAPPPPLPATASLDDLPDDAALVIGTSGSTGSPKRAVLTRASLSASAHATHARLGGPGRWVLALPAHHVAGVQVVLRSLLAGHAPAVVPDLAAGFDPDRLAATIVLARREDPGARLYCSLVPTQLARLVDRPGALGALASLDGVLVGGAVASPDILNAARAAGVAVHETYGMSETSGGCVYDGVALDGVHVRVEDERIHLGGPVVADGYLGDPVRTRQHFDEVDGVRWFRTDDLGEVGADGRLRVIGRADDLIITGGLKVAPRLVEEAAVAHLPAREAVVVGTPDAEWGEVVALAVLPAGSARDGDLRVGAVRDALRAHLPGHALPRRVIALEAMPYTGPGKPDRRAVRSLFAP